MKILFVGVFNKESTNTSQLKGFKNLGCDVLEYPYRDKLSLFNNNIELRDNDLIKVCESYKPDITLFSKCNNMDSYVVYTCNRFSKTVYWYMDYIHNLTDECLSKIRLSDYVFCSRNAALNIASKINNKSYFLHEGFDEENNIYINDIEQDIDVSFIGTLNDHGCHNNRTEYQKEIQFKVYNNVYNIEHSKTVCRSKINLNFTEGDGSSDRIYKLLASKGFVLTQPWEGIDNDFTIGRDLDTFNNINELKEKINYYLDNNDIRLQIAENGYKTVQKFNRTNWAKTIINIVK